MSDRLQLVARITAIIEGATENPAESLIREGEAIRKIGEVLKGRSVSDSREIIAAVAHCMNVKEPTP